MRTIIKVTLSVTMLASAVLLAANNFNLEQFQDSLLRFDPLNLSVVVIAILLSSMLAAMRVRSIALSVGYRMTVRDSFAVLSLGQLGGALFFQIFGQLAARGSYLTKRNVPFAGTVIITAQERIAAALVSFGLAIVGALYLFRQLSFDLTSGGFDLVRIVIGLIFAGALVGVVWRDAVVDAIDKITWAGIIGILRSIAFSAGVQITMMTAYVVAARSLAPQIDLMNLAAAASLVMFAASIPISFAGWGVREISAIGALGAIGMSSPAALTVSVTIGALSILCAAILALASVRRVDTDPDKLARVETGDVSRHEAILNAVLPILVAFLVFFQIHIPTQGGTVNFNIADPFAIICSILFLIQARRTAPEWRYKHLPLYLAAMTTVITIGLCIGATHIGWTTWAVVNKYLGWFVLLAYGAAGAMASRVNLEKALLTFSVAGCAVAIFAIAYMLLLKAGMVPFRFFSGFSQNNNAFAFLCLMLLAVGLTLPRYMMTVITIALIAIILTGSRAGIGAAAVVLIIATVIIPGIWRDVIFALSIAGLVTHSLTLWHGAGMVGGSIIETMTFIRPSSDAEHLITVKQGLAMFTNNWVWGAGLGSFIAQWKGDYPLIIHNSAVWILAEFGLMGAVIFFVPAIYIVAQELRRFRSNDAKGHLLILVITGFGAMSLFHELLYQRSMWFLLGATLIVVHRAKGTDELPKQMI